MNHAPVGGRRAYSRAVSFQDRLGAFRGVSDKVAR
jgi:hypothetical protein